MTEAIENDLRAAVDELWVLPGHGLPPGANAWQPIRASDGRVVCVLVRGSSGKGDGLDGDLLREFWDNEIDAEYDNT